MRRAESSDLPSPLAQGRGWKQIQQNNCSVLTLSLLAQVDRNINWKTRYDWIGAFPLAKGRGSKLVKPLRRDRHAQSPLSRLR
jgi:hypothetical protein